MQFLNLSFQPTTSAYSLKSYQMRQYNYQKVNKHISLALALLVHKQLCILFYCCSETAKVREDCKFPITYRL